MLTKILFVQYFVFLCTSLCHCIPLEQQESAPEITEYTNELTDGGGYFFKFNLNNGHQREERGELVKKDGKEFLVVSGFYSFIATDGQEYFTEYTSDENGYTSNTKVSEPSVGIPSAALASLAGGGLG